MHKIEFIRHGSWEWSNGTGTVFSRDFRLLADGKIGGYTHPNECSWQYLDSKITIFDKDGNPSTVLSEESHDDEIRFVGSFLNDPSGHTKHLLTRRKPTVGCFFRTHFWDGSVQKAYEHLRKAWGGDVVVTSDQTRPFAIPESLSEIGHRVDDFERLGLAAQPSKQLTLWFNGDYPLYHLALNTDFDYLLVCECDLVFQNIDLRMAIESMIANGDDCVGPILTKLAPGHYWYDQQCNWTRAEKNLTASDPDPDVTWFFFPLILITRQAALYLFARRIEMAHLLRTGKINTAWPFCETFVPTELVKAGFQVTNLSDYVSGRMHMTSADVCSWREVEQMPECIIHPVNRGGRFASVLLNKARGELERGQPVSEWLKSQLSRDMDDEDRIALTTLIASL